MKLASSGALLWLIAAVCGWVPSFVPAITALLMTLAVIALADVWGVAEAITGAMVGAAAMRLTQSAGTFFLLVFLATSLLLILFVTRRNETEKLYRFVNALLDCDHVANTTQHLADLVVGIFNADAVAIFDTHTQQVTRSGPRASEILDLNLRETSSTGRLVRNRKSGLSLVPVRHADEVMGSMGVISRTPSANLLLSIAMRVGLGLARLYTLERANEAEVARRSEELKSAVLDAMAHEIRNPLNSIKLAVTTLISGSLAKEADRRQMLDVINEEASRMDVAIDQTVHLAGLEAGELPLKKEPQSIPRLVQMAIQELGTRAALRHVQVRLPSSLPPAECDTDMIRRVLKELLNNAIKYSPEQSPLIVSAEFDDTKILIHVVDSGPGIAEDEQEHIFDKYYRGPLARLRGPGTGLGLASVRSVARAHGGEIWVTSPPGGGAAFHLCLPASINAGRAAGTCG